jgi:UDP:flavonoid glycosyltransferase YjiC (YdhE family)
MAQILMVLWGIRGRNMAALTLGRRLAEAGHTVTVASTEDLDDLAAHARLPFHRWPDVVSRQRSWRDSTAVAGFVPDALSALRALSNRRDQLVDHEALATVRSGLRALAPDLVLCDIELPQFTIVAAADGFPVAQLHRAPDLAKHPGVPPIHTPLVPTPVGDATRFRIEWAWVKRRAANLWHAVSRSLRSLGTDRAAALARLAGMVDYDLRHEVTKLQWLRPFTFRRVPVLLMQVRDFDFPRPPESTARYLGPLIDPGRERPAGPEEQAALVKFLAVSGPVVLCAFGAYYPHDDRSLFRAVIDMARERPGVRFVLGLGDRFAVSEAGVLPDNVLVLRWVPQLAVLSRADAAIVHGGASTVLECIHHGVPMVVLPFDMNDQQGNAARVAYHRIGLVRERARATPESLGRALDVVLGDREIRERCARLGEVSRRCEEEGQAVREVEALLAELS